MKKASGWSGPIPPAIAKCNDMWVARGFKKLCKEAQEVLYMQKSERRDEREAELNRRLADLIHQAERENAKKN